MTKGINAMAEDVKTGWLPIDSAPRDGTPILLLSAEGEIGLGYIEVSPHNGKDRGSAAWISRRDGFGEQITEVWVGGTRPYNANCWMPLPTVGERGGERDG